jgi:hypothetical protein
MNYNPPWGRDWLARNQPSRLGVERRERRPNVTSVAATFDEAIEYSWSPLEWIRAIRDALGKRLERASSDQRVRALDSLIALLEGETRNAFVRAAPENVEKIAEDLGARHWKLCHYTLCLSIEIAGEEGIVPSRVFKDPVENWLELAHYAQQLLPFLPPTARKRIRAVAFLLAKHGSVAETKAEVAEASGGDPTWPYCVEPLPGVAAFSVLGEALLIAGTSDAFGPERTEAIAAAWWRSARDDFDESLIEEAWDRASLVEAELLEEPTPEPWDDVRARIVN